MHSVVYVVCYTTINEHMTINNIAANNHDHKQLIVNLTFELYT